MAEKKEKYPQAPLGSGMLRKAADAIKGREGRLKKALGEYMETTKKKK